MGAPQIRKVSLPKGHPQVSQSAWHTSITTVTSEKDNGGHGGATYAIQTWYFLQSTTPFLTGIVTHRSYPHSNTRSY